MTISSEHFELMVSLLAQKEVLTFLKAHNSQESDEAYSGLLERLFESEERLENLDASWVKRIKQAYLSALRTQYCVQNAVVRTFEKQGGTCDSCEYFFPNTVEQNHLDDVISNVDTLLFCDYPMEYDPDCVLYPGRTDDLSSGLEHGKLAICPDYKQVDKYCFIDDLNRQIRVRLEIEKLIGKARKVN